MGHILQDASIVGEHRLIQREDEEFDANLRRMRIAAETLSKPMTFFEAVEALKFPAEEPSDDKQKGAAAKSKKVKEIKYEEHHYTQVVNLSGFRNLRFSRAGL